jgi:L-asparaginase/Glu-tRNA(Gln) amidotransferase subunit D
LSGLRDKLVYMEDGGIYLKAAYRALNVSKDSSDRVIRFQSESALGTLDEIMREQLFFSDAQLRGENIPKIRIIQ